MTVQSGKTAGPNYEITNLNPSTNPKNSSNPSIDFPQNNRAKRDLTPTASGVKERYYQREDEGKETEPVHGVFSLNLATIISS